MADLTEKITAAYEAKKNSESDRSPMTPIQTFLLDLLIITSVLWILFSSVIGAVTAPNNDMSPSIKVKDLLIYYRLSRDYRAQDAVVLMKNNTTYIGRIVAVGGDSVDITDDEKLIINGNMVSEPDISSPTPRFEGFTDYPVLLGKNEFFVLADTRKGAEDSRYYGKISKNDVRGKIITVIRRNNI